jgi:tetratricopeptide (TPR) repeat protein
MPRIHPKPEVLRGLIQLLPETRARFLHHVQACPSCREALTGRLPRDRGGVLSWRPSVKAVGRAIDGVLSSFRSRIQAAARERAEAPFLLAALLAQRPERREILARNSRRFRSLALCGLLVDRGHEASVDAPGEAETLATLALALVDALDAGWYTAKVLADTRGRCWMVVGNARRVATDLAGAEEAFRQAAAALRQGTGDPTEKAQLLVYRAFLRQAQQRPDEAAVLFRRTVAIFLSAGDSLRAAESVGWLAEVEHPQLPLPPAPPSPAMPLSAERRRGGWPPRPPAARTPRR